MARYRVLQGIDYGDKRAEAGDVVDDIPQRSIKWLVDQGIIEQESGSAPSKKIKQVTLEEANAEGPGDE